MQNGDTLKIAHTTIFCLTAEWWSVIITAVIAIATIWYVIVTKGILKSNLLAIQQTRDIFLRTNRPYLFIDNVIFGTLAQNAPVMLHVKIANAGQMPGKITFFRTTLFLTPPNEATRIVQNPVDSGKEIEPRGDFNYALPLNPVQIGIAFNPAWKFEILTELRYTDEIGKVEYTPKAERREYKPEHNVFLQILEDETTNVNTEGNA